jgi:hypothetical protein
MGTTEDVIIKEQVVADLVSGLTLTFWRTSNGEGRLRIEGDAVSFARDLQFDAHGALVGSGSPTGASCPLRLAN